MDAETRIIIVGAAAAGLSLACALREKGFYNVKVVEKAGSPTELELEAPINLGANVVRAYDLLDLKNQLLSRSWHWDGVQILNKQGKQLVFMDGHKIAKRCGHQAITTTRAHMLKVLRSSIPEGWIEYGSEVSSVIERTKSLEVTFADGRVEIADILIGANGYYSDLRTQVMGPTEAREDGKLSLQAVIPNIGGKAAVDIPDRNVFTEIITTNGSVGFGQCSENDFNVFFNVIKSDVQDDLNSQVLLDYVIRKFGGIDPRVDQLTNAVEAKNLLIYYPKDRPLQTGWSKGRIVLIGDAAHPAFQYVGQGAAMAMESALVLADSLASASSYSEAFTLFEKRRLPRIKVVHAESFRGSKVFGMSNPTLCFVRDTVMRLVPNVIKTKPLVHIHAGDFLA